MTNANDSHNDPVIHELRIEARDALDRVPPEVLPSLLTFLHGITDNRRTPATPGTMRRFGLRVQLMRRYGELRADPAYAKRPKLWIVKRVLAEVNWSSVRYKPIKFRTTMWWIQNWNQVGDDGLAVGIRAIIDSYGQVALKGVHTGFETPLKTY